MWEMDCLSWIHFRCLLWTTTHVESGSCCCCHLMPKLLQTWRVTFGESATLHGVISAVWMPAIASWGGWRWKGYPALPKEVSRDEEEARIVELRRTTPKNDDLPKFVLSNRRRRRYYSGQSEESLGASIYDVQKGGWGSRNAAYLSTNSINFAARERSTG